MTTDTPERRPVLVLQVKDLWDHLEPFTDALKAGGYAADTTHDYRLGAQWFIQYLEGVPLQNPQAQDVDSD